MERVVPVVIKFRYSAFHVFPDNICLEFQTTSSFRESCSEARLQPSFEQTWKPVEDLSPRLAAVQVPKLVSVAKWVTILGHRLAKKKLWWHGKSSLFVSVRASTALLRLLSTGFLPARHATNCATFLLTSFFVQVYFFFWRELSEKDNRLHLFFLPELTGVRQGQNYHRTFWILQDIIDGDVQGFVSGETQEAQIRRGNSHASWSTRPTCCRVAGTRHLELLESVT